MSAKRIVWTSGLPAILMLAHAAYLIINGLGLPSDHPFYAFYAYRLFGFAAMSVALAAALWRTWRWARWITLGWALDVPLNIALATIHRPPDTFAISLAAGALVMLVLLGRPGARAAFEPEWTTPVHRAYRWTAICVSACLTHTLVAGGLAIATGGWSAVFAAALMLAALALLSAQKFVGLSIAVAALIARVLVHNSWSHEFNDAASFEVWARSSESWVYFGGVSWRVLWVWAAFATLAAHALVLPHLARHMRLRAAVAIVLASLAVGFGIGVVAGFENTEPPFIPY